MWDTFTRHQFGIIIITICNIFIFHFIIYFFGYEYQQKKLKKKIEKKIKFSFSKNARNEVSVVAVAWRVAYGRGITAEQRHVTSI